MKKILIALLLIVGCQEAPIPTPLFEKGELVKIKVTGEIGMVQSYSCWRGEEKCHWYWVRLGNGSQVIDSGLFADTAKIDRLPVLKFKDFELEKAK